jgi:hypothetical protein
MYSEEGKKSKSPAKPPFPARDSQRARLPAPSSGDGGEGSSSSGQVLVEHFLVEHL